MTSSTISAGGGEQQSVGTLLTNTPQYGDMQLRYSATASYCLGFVLAVAVTFRLYPISFLAGRSNVFDTGDTAQHVSGWLFYVADDWHFPLLTTTRMDPPNGVPIFLTDSIPLAAVVLKLFAGLLPSGFHYFGIWHLVSAVGQAVGAIYLIRGLGRRDLFSAFVTSFLALLWPLSLWRFGHTALATHAVVLFAIGFYVRSRVERWDHWTTHTAFGLLNLAALMIHPYLVAMTMPIQVAVLLDRLQETGRRRSALLWMTGSLVGLAVAAWALGYMSAGSGRTTGFGVYSMNVASPFCGGNLSPCGVLDVTGGQYEGYAYLGFGFIALLPVAVWVGRKDILSAMRSSPAIFTLAVLFCIYAVSNRVFVGPYELFSYQIPVTLVPITEIFRASGRFFWPVSYGLLAGVLAIVLARRSGEWLMRLLLVMLALQWGDTQPFRVYIREFTSVPPQYDFDKLAHAIPNLTKIIVFPDYGCFLLDEKPYIFFQLLAARLGGTINAAYHARHTPTCDPGSDSFLKPLERGVLFVSRAAEISSEPQPPLVEAAKLKGECVEVDWHKMVLCSSDPVDWTEIREQLKVPAN